jgi:hypothetical protein
MRHDELISYLNKNKHLLNLSGIAKASDINISVLNNALAGRTDGHGTVQKIPKKHLPKLLEVLKELQNC